MPARTAYLEFLHEQLAPLGEISSRAMMGGHIFYCGGVVFALVASNALYLKTDDVNRREFHERGLRAFRPYRDSETVMSYYEAPPEIFEDPEAMKHWCGGAVEAGRRTQRKKKSRGKRAAGR